MLSHPTKQRRAEPSTLPPSTTHLTGQSEELRGNPLTRRHADPGHRPVVTVLIIAVNALVFLLELAGGDAFVQRWSVIPANVVSGRHWITILTSMFMHGGWMHIIGNMVFFWAFGPRSKTPWARFVISRFYLLSGSWHPQRRLRPCPLPRFLIWGRAERSPA